MSSIALSSCGSEPQMAPSYTVSVGQQISDLDRARADGLITKREYDRLKRGLIKRYD